MSDSALFQMVERSLNKAKLDIYTRRLILNYFKYLHYNISILL